MKKFVSLLLTLCLVLGIASVALADQPVITAQPTSQATDRYGSVIFTFNATGFNNRISSWHFVDPTTGDDRTGPEMREYMGKTGFKLDVYNEKKKMVLTNVPASMNGWTIYAHLVNDSGEFIDTDRVTLTVTAATTAAATTTTTTAAANGTQTAAAQTTADGTQAVAAIPEVETGPKVITVTAEKVSLFPVDSRGNLTSEQPVSSLTFEDSGNVMVRSETPVRYWMVNGMRIEPTEDVNSFLLKNVTSNLKISAKLAKTTTTENVDPNTPCQVTCTGCTFTYHAGGLSSVTSGEVPMGATIIVLATNTAAVNSGYTINDEGPENVGSKSFTLKIEEDTEISLP